MTWGTEEPSMSWVYPCPGIVKQEGDTKAWKQHRSAWQGLTRAWEGQRCRGAFWWPSALTAGGGRENPLLPVWSGEASARPDSPNITQVWWKVYAAPAWVLTQMLKGECKTFIKTQMLAAKNYGFESKMLQARWLCTNIVTLMSLKKITFSTLL